MDATIVPCNDHLPYLFIWLRCSRSLVAHVFLAYMSFYI